PGAGPWSELGSNAQNEGRGRNPIRLLTRAISLSLTQNPRTKRPLPMSNSRTESYPVDAAKSESPSMKISWQCFRYRLENDRTGLKSESYTKISSLAAR